MQLIRLDVRDRINSLSLNVGTQEKEQVPQVKALTRNATIHTSAGFNTPFHRNFLQQLAAYDVFLFHLIPLTSPTSL